VNTVNQIILTLREADGFARSQNPHHHRLAIVLLDNIVELQLRRKSVKAFAWDNTTWYSGVRKYDRKRRKAVSKYHGELLGLAVEEGWITEGEKRLLEYAHRVRNRLYHEGHPEDRIDLSIALTLLYRLIRRRFSEWKNGGLPMREYPNPAIKIEDARSDKTGHSPLIVGDEERHDVFSEEYWSQVIERCMTFDDTGDVRPLIKRRTDNLLDKVQGSIDLLTEEPAMDFIPVLAQRFSVLSPAFARLEISRIRMTNPAAALNIYLAVLDSEEWLLDIADETERAKEFERLVNSHSFEMDIISHLRLDEYREMAESVTTQPEEEGIARFLEIEEDLEKLAWAAAECACDLDNHIQFLIDESRGK
jgi:hypothetical protein